MIKLSKPERLILYSLGEFYKQLNQPLKEKPLQLRTSKIAFITFVLHSEIITKQERALYKNIESLEKKKLITYDKRMIKFTEKGLKILARIEQEIEQFVKISEYFRRKEMPKSKLQTVIRF
ncbi:MAG: hypothetical protein KJ597_04760 [Nanoarchaeota archaeon]|nr:hypothetical protein [Nanoarchaeota archaeon]